MKRIAFIVGLLAAASAFAQTPPKVSQNVGPWYAYQGSLFLQPKTAYTSSDACMQSVQALVDAGKVKAGNYGCTQSVANIVTFTVTATPKCQATAPVKTQTAACPAGSTGAGYVQTMGFASAPYPTCWTETTWSPTTPPAGACTTIPTPPPNPFPNGETQTVQCVAPTTGSWTQTRTYTLTGTTWTAGPWTPSSPPAGACTTPPTGTTVTNWVSIATEHDSFSYVGAARYGYPGFGWINATLKGASTCDNGSFPGGDPAGGQVKVCQVQVSAPNVVQTGLAPVINMALANPPMKGSSAKRIANGGDYGGSQVQDIGAFRINADFSHFLFDDPIVFPGQPGKSHLHTFMGNTSMNAATTPANIRNCAASTSMGGVLNCSGYWMPALINLTNGAPIVPYGPPVFYYKSGYAGVKAPDVKAFPQGLRMITGDASNKTAPDINSWGARIICSADGVIQNQIPNCPKGSTIEFMLVFPQCWDGVNLDSPDHKSHMARAVGTTTPNGCPTTHPIPLPEVTTNFYYLVDIDRPDLNWKLSSDNYAGPGGWSLHADWFGGWDQTTMDTWVTKCINPFKSSSGDLCNGTYLY